MSEKSTNLEFRQGKKLYAVVEVATNKVVSTHETKEAAKAERNSIDPGWKKAHELVKSLESRLNSGNSALTDEELRKEIASAYPRHQLFKVSKGVDHPHYKG